MKRLLTVACLTVTIATVIGCNGGGDPQAGKQAIQDLEKQWNQDYVAKDPDKLAAYYAEDAVLMAPGMPPSVGRENIRATLKQMVADPVLSLKFTAAMIDVARSGDLGYTRGSYVLTMTDPQTKKVIHDQGSYVTTYRREADGSWKAVTDIASLQGPTAPSGAM
jgi:uncharacterized protein (TIGR02246 family)